MRVPARIGEIGIKAAVLTQAERFAGPEVLSLRAFRLKFFGAWADLNKTT